MKTMNKNQTILPFPLSPPLSNPIFPQTVAIAIGIAFTILIIINQSPLSFSPTIPFVAHKFSCAFSSNIKQKIYKHRHCPIVFIKRTRINHCYHCCCHCCHRHHRHLKKSTHFCPPSSYYLCRQQILPCIIIECKKKIYNSHYHPITFEKQSIINYHCCHYHYSHCQHSHCHCHHKTNNNLLLSLHLFPSLLTNSLTIFIN